VLSIVALKSVSQALTYYQKDNYYTKDIADIEASTAWTGKGAAELGLQGPVKFDDFKDLLSGKLSDGTQLGWDETATAAYNAAHPDKKRSAHRPGYDLTFSAPKSASLLALCANDKRIIKAHQDAVEHALHYVEHNAAMTRTTTHKETQFVETKNLVIAKFLHDVSRDLDPQLHTHCVVMNATQTASGWRSISSEALFEQKMTAGSLYRAYFAFELKKLGYEITKTHADGRFEIAGIPDPVIKHFSKRRSAIEQALIESQRVGAKASADITLLTRQSKRPTEKDVLYDRWQKEAQDLGFNFSPIAEKAKSLEGQYQSKLDIQALNTVQIADKAVAFAISHLSEYQSTFNHNTLAAVALRESVGQWISPETIAEAIERAKAQNVLLSEGKEYTTLFLRQQETALLNHLNQAQSLTPIAHFNYFVERMIKNHALPLTHATLAREILKSNSHFIVANHFQSADLESVKQIGHFAQNRNYTVRLFSPTQKSADWLTQRTKLTSQSFGHILATPLDKIKQFSSRQLWFIHKAESLSTKDLNELTARATLAKAHVVFLVNDKNVLSLKAGNAPQLLKNTSLKKVALRDPTIPPETRNKSNELMLSTDKLLTQIHQKTQLIEISDGKEREQAIVNHAMSYPDTAVMVSGVRERQHLNQAIREAKKALGHIKGEEKTVTIWVKQSFSVAEKTLSSSYQLGNQCLFDVPNRKLGIEQQHPYVISNIKDSLLYLTSLKGKTLRWDPSRHSGAEHVTLYQQQHRAIATGDVIRLSQPNKGQWQKGDTATISKIYRHKIKIQSSNGRKATLHLHKNHGQQWDYAYTINPYQQIDNAQPLLLVLDSKSFNLASSRALLTNYQQNERLPWLVTDDKIMLQKKLACLPPSPSLATDKAFSDKVALPAAIKLNSAYFMMQLAKDCVRYALDHLTEREAVFKQADLTKLALSLSLGSTPPTYIEQATKSMEIEGALIRINKHQSTTLASLEQEQAIVNWVKEGKNALTPLLEPKALKASLKQLSTQEANSEQKQAIFHILTSRHELIGVQGYAGTGKTRMLQWIKHYANATGIQVAGIAPSAAAGQQIQRKAGIKSYTLEKYLQNATKPFFRETQGHKPSLLIIDESSMASTRQFAALKSAVRGLSLHVVAIGDTQQLQAIEQGKPFSLLQSGGMKMVTLKNIQRQTSPLLRQIVYDSLNPKTLHRAFEKLAPHIQEDAGRSISGSMHTLVENYQKLSREERADTLILTASNADKNALNTLIREILNDKKELQGAAVTYPILVNRDLTLTQMTLANNYHEGDILRFNAEHKRIGISSGSYWHVIKVNPETNQLTLKDNDNGIREWSPHASKGQRGMLEVYRQEERQLQAGDSIRWRRNDEAQGIFNAQSATITELGKQHATVKLTNGKIIPAHFSDFSYQHWDYGYVSTIHVAQGDDGKRVLVLLNSHTKILHTERSFYVALSRAKSVITLYTDNKKEIAEAIFKQSGEKSSSLASLEYYPFKNDAAKKHQISAQTDRSNTINKTELKTLAADPLSSLKSNNAVSSPESLNNRVLQTNIKASSVKLDAKFIQQGLAAQAESVAITLLGKAKKRVGSALLFGKNKGSLHVHTTGEKQGLWYDFQTGEGGNLIQLIQQVKQCDFKEALLLGAKLTHHAFSYHMTSHQPSVNPENLPVKTNHKALTVSQQRMRDYARRLFQEAKPMSNTLGEKYLAMHRYLQAPYPPSVRFHPSLRHTETKTHYPAVLFAATDKDNQLQAVQAVFLDPATGNKAMIDNAKKSYGPLRGASVDLQQSKSDILAIAEGPETALSIAKAFPHINVKATLGLSNMQHIDLPQSCKQLLLCADNDGANTSTDKQYKKILQSLASLEKAVHFVQPIHHKEDFNDVLKRQGLEAIQNTIKQQTTLSLSEAPPLTPAIIKSLAPIYEQPPTKISAPEKITSRSLPAHVPLNPPDISFEIEGR